MMRNPFVLVVDSKRTREFSGACTGVVSASFSIYLHWRNVAKLRLHDDDVSS